MKAHGIDEILRGQFNEEIYAGDHMLSFFHGTKQYSVGSQTKETWIKERSRKETETPTPKDWFGRDHTIDGGEVNKE